MGGIVLVNTNRKGVIVGNGQKTSPSKEPQIRGIRFNYAGLGVSGQNDGSEGQVDIELEREVILDYDIFKTLIAKDPTFEILIPENEIEDKAKGDVLTKLIAVIQVSWFVAQCIARFVKGLAVTELEIVTLALASLNVIMCALWWSKPLGLRVPFKMALKELPDPQYSDKSDFFASSLSCERPVRALTNIYRNDWTYLTMHQSFLLRYDG